MNNLLNKLKKAIRQFTNKTSEEMAKKLHYKVGTPIVIYKETPTFVDGGVGIIIERDPFTISYGVVLLEAYYAYEGDVQKLMKRELKWVDQGNLYPINFDKKITLLERIKDGIAKLVTRFKKR